MEDLEASQRSILFSRGRDLLFSFFLWNLRSHGYGVRTLDFRRDYVCDLEICRLEGREDRSGEDLHLRSANDRNRSFASRNWRY